MFSYLKTEHFMTIFRFASSSQFSALFDLYIYIYYIAIRCSEALWTFTCFQNWNRTIIKGVINFFHLQDMTKKCEIIRVFMEFHQSNQFIRKCVNYRHRPFLLTTKPKKECNALCHSTNSFRIRIIYIKVSICY